MNTPALAPRDGRFGSGPSKVRPEQIQAIVDAAGVLGTSHRRPAVKSIVATIRSGLRQLFNLPEGYEVLLGNGGATALWDAIALGLVEKKAQAVVVGEFSGKAARAVTKAPWLDDAEVIEGEPGTQCIARDDVDTYIYAHNETSIGACTQLRRFGGPGALTVVDGTSIAGGVCVDVAATDFYYFSPQKCFGADGGLWVAFASPAALARIERLTSERWVPDFLNLAIAAKNSVKDQTYNTPALTTLIMLANQIDWMLDEGGLAAMESRTRANSDAVYEWAAAQPGVSPLIKDRAFRSPTVATLSTEPSLNISAVTVALRERGIVDIEPYRSLGKDGLRIGCFPAIELADIHALLGCLTEALGTQTSL